MSGMPDPSLESLRVKLNYRGKSVRVDESYFGTSWRQDLVQEVDQVLGKYAPRVSERARALLRARLIHPERSTGRLSRSIRWRHNQPGSVTVYAGAPYGGYVERGTRFFGGHHMIADAKQEYMPMIRAEVEEAKKRALERMGRA